jgi:hypothetical protein
MPAHSPTRTRLRLALAPAAFLAAALAVTAGAQQPEPKKSADPVPPKADTKGKEKEPRVIKLPDGTYLWLGTPDGSDERVTLTPDELQKLLDQAEQLKKQLAARKPTPPSGCAIRGKVEKRGEQLVAVLKLTLTFRTPAPQTAVALGGKRGFLVAASLDGDKLAILEPTEDGPVVLVEKPGAHTMTLEIEAPVSSRGAKPELGFEIGLPRAPITTLLFDAPGPEVKRVNLTTRTPEPGKIAPPEPRRTAALDISHLAPRSGHENGHALGPIDSLEVTWDPPATAAQPADQLRSAEFDITVQLTEAVVEATAKVRLRGASRDWKLLAPATADVTLDRAPGAPADVGPALPPVVSKVTEQNRTVWKIELPLGSSAADWMVTAVTRQPRPKPDDPKHRGPFTVGPFAVSDVLRQTGTVVVRAAPHTRFAFKHGPDLRKAEPTKLDAAGPIDDETTAAFFRLLTGPTGANPANAPLFSFEAWPQPGDVAVRPTYRLTLTDAGWRVRAEVRVFPIRTEVDSLTVEVPAEWRGLEASPPELVEGVQPGTSSDGFWTAAAARLSGSLRVPVVVRLAAGHRQPFDLVLTATVPAEPGDVLTPIPMPRFPGAFEREASANATVPEGLEVRGELREWDGEFAPWGPALAPPPGADGKPPRVATTVAARAEAGIARVLLAWNPHRPDLTADVRAEVVVGERQLEITQRMTLRSAEGLPRQLRFRGPTGTANLRSQPTLIPSGGDWLLPVVPDTKELTLTATFVVPLPPRPADAGVAWSVPVALLWPANAGRTEATVRVWSSAGSARTITTSSAGWRELVAEPSLGRDSLPALSVSASGAELPLVLEVREVGNPGAVAVWVERGLVQAWAGGESPTEYRARFLLRRWLTPSVEIRLPGPLAGPAPEFRIDGLKANATPLSDGAERAYRVSLPAPGRPVAVEVRYQLPAPPGRAGEAVYQPPQLPSAAFAGPVRWQVTLPAGAVPLLAGGGRAEFRWRLGGAGLAPSPTGTAEGLEQWFRTGDEPGDDSGGNVLTVRQPSLGALTVYRVQRTGLLVVCSVVTFVVVLGLSLVPRRVMGLVVAVLGCAAGVAAVMLPHPAAWAVAGCQPGLAAAALVLGALALARLAYRRRMTHLPTFSRTAPEPDADVLPIASSARKRPSGAGSGASATPAGG